MEKYGSNKIAMITMLNVFLFLINLGTSNDINAAPRYSTCDRIPSLNAKNDNNIIINNAKNSIFRLK